MKPTYCFAIGHDPNTPALRCSPLRPIQGKLIFNKVWGFEILVERQYEGRNSVEDHNRILRDHVHYEEDFPVARDQVEFCQAASIG